jgi:hypothetical protein
MERAVRHVVPGRPHWRLGRMPLVLVGSMRHMTFVGGKLSGRLGKLIKECIESSEKKVGIDVAHFMPGEQVFLQPV